MFSLILRESSAALILICINTAILPWLLPLWGLPDRHQR